ncbi:hypothetical protein Fmac_001953 [Flemingia macrophylla]|uniref:Late embryogenesis abundant protein LEA-2 subgroup domain-containing protein n=1 Tax=Flemingia macrophylla TaxID=520843 RepID=A0ABD1NII8_9FABA
MAKGENRTNLASCFVATVFLLFLLIVLFIVYFTLFKPQDPKIAVAAVQIPSFSVANATANFAFSQYSSVRNPNRGTFSHYDSSLHLLYHGTQLGFMFVPAGKIHAGGTQHMAATFTVHSLPLGLANGPGNVIELVSTISMAGRVRVLHLFSHHVQAQSQCRVAVAVADGTNDNSKHPIFLSKLA